MCPHLSGVGAFRPSSRTGLRETLGCSIDRRKLVLGLDAISCIHHRVKASSSSVKHIGYAQSRYIKVLRKKVSLSSEKKIGTEGGNKNAIVWQGVYILWVGEKEMNEACRLPGH